MPVAFRCSMFFLSFVPLWLCIAFNNAMSIANGAVNNKTEIIWLVVLAVLFLCSGFNVRKVLKKEQGQNYEKYNVNHAEEDKVSTTEYLLSNAVPLLAFDFTQWQTTVPFLIIFSFLFVLCMLHNRYDGNVCLEVLGYRIYNCWANNEMGAKDGIKVIIRSKALNTNDVVFIREIGGDLYFGYLK